MEVDVVTELLAGIDGFPPEQLVVEGAAGVQIGAQEIDPTRCAFRRDVSHHRFTPGRRSDGPLHTPRGSLRCRRYGLAELIAAAPRPGRPDRVRSASARRGT